MEGQGHSHLLFGKDAASEGRKKEGSASPRLSRGQKSLGDRVLSGDPFPFLVFSIFFLSLLYSLPLPSFSLSYLFFFFLVQPKLC